MNENGESDPSNEDRALEPCGSAVAMALPGVETTTLTESGDDPAVTRYYFFGGKRASMDREGVLQYLLGDHLGHLAPLPGREGAGEGGTHNSTTPTGMRVGSRLATLSMMQGCSSAFLTLPPDRFQHRLHLRKNIPIREANDMIPTFIQPFGAS